MIDVPVRVKDALRSGDYKKEYIIQVEDYYSFNYTPQAGSLWVTQNLECLKEGMAIKLSMPKPYAFESVTFGKYNEQGAFNILLDLTSVVTETESYVNFIVPYEMTKGNILIAFISLSGFSVYNSPVYFNVVLKNENLISESVKFDERMCSDNILKFGLCEGTSVEFQYFDLPNIRNKHIVITIRVQYKNTSGSLSWHEIPMGQFDVDECSRQANTGIIKVVAYNKLKSAYLDRAANAEIEQIIRAGEEGVPNQASISAICKDLLDGYSIPYTDFIEVNGKTVVEQIDGSYYYKTVEPRYDISHEYWGKWTIFYLTVRYCPEDATTYETDGHYKYAINTPLIWDMFKDVVRYCYDDTAQTRREMTGPNDYIIRYDTTHGHSDYNFLPYFAENPIIGQNEYYEGSILSKSGYRESISANRSDILETGVLTQSYIRIRVPFYVAGYEVPSENWWLYIETAFNEMVERLSSVKLATIYQLNESEIEKKKITLSEFLAINNNVTLRDLQAAVFEVDCQYGKLDRVTDLFSGIELNNGALYPRDDLYPADELFPMGTSESGYPSMYSKLWADEGNVRSFRYLIITYKTTETISGQTQEVEKTLQRTVNANGTDDYIMDDNWLFKNLVWTDAQVGDYADAMVTKMQNIRWFPFEMWCAGLPYLEAGDEIEIQMKEGTYKSYVLRRTLSGIQNLQDEMINGTLDIF